MSPPPQDGQACPSAPSTVVSTFIFSSASPLGFSANSVMRPSPSICGGAKKGANTEKGEVTANSAMRPSLSIGAQRKEEEGRGGAVRCAWWRLRPVGIEPAGMRRHSTKKNMSKRRAFMRPKSEARVASTGRQPMVTSAPVARWWSTNCGSRGWGGQVSLGLESRPCFACSTARLLQGGEQQQHAWACASPTACTAMPTSPLLTRRGR